MINKSHLLPLFSVVLHLKKIQACFALTMTHMASVCDCGVLWWWWSAVVVVECCGGGGVLCYELVAVLFFI